MEIIGWIGNILLSFCGLPEAIRAVFRKKCEVPWSLLIPWFLGEVLVLVYVVYKYNSAPLITNYCANIIIILIMGRYKIYDKSNN